MYTKSNYRVSVTEYAQRHYIKSFSKKYKSAWDKTLITIENLLSRIVVFRDTSKVHKIHICDTKYIAKCEFNIE